MYKTMKNILKIITAFWLTLQFCSVLTAQTSDTTSYQNYVNTNIVTNGTRSITATHLNYSLLSSMAISQKFRREFMDSVRAHRLRDFYNITANKISDWNTVFNWYNSNPLSSYAFANGSNVSGTWGINISGNAATASSIPWTSVTGRPTLLSEFTNNLGLGSNAYTSTPFVPQSGFSFGSSFTLGTVFNGTSNQNVPVNLLGGYSNGYIYNFNQSQIQSWLGLGSYAYRSNGLIEWINGSISNISNTYYGGFYQFFNPTNKPSVGGSNDWGWLNIPVWNGNNPSEWYAMQIAGHIGDNELYFRNATNGSGTWRTIYTTDGGTITGSQTVNGTIFANSVGQNIRLYGDGGSGNDGFVGATSDGTLYFRNWSGSRGFTINSSGLLSHIGSISITGNFSGSASGLTGTASNLTAGRVATNLISPSSNTTLTTAHDVIRPTANCTLTLPDATTCGGKTFQIFTRSAINVTVNTVSSQKMYLFETTGSETITIGNFSVLVLVSDGVGWISQAYYSGI